MSYKFKSTCLKSSLLPIFLLLLQHLSAQYNWSALDAELQAKQKALGTDVTFMIWGKSTTGTKSDTVVYKKDLGMFNSKTTAPIGDASTWLTAALVMMFVDEGKLSLDDKISQWVPEFARYGKNYITLRHCLSHFTGVDDDDKLLKKMFTKRTYNSLEDEVNSFAARKIRTNPGTDFWYGNVGPNIAGRVLEVISKKRFDVLIKQKLFNPMTMRRSSFTSFDGMLVDPAGGASTNADDYMKFMVMLMNKGKFGGKQILSEASVEELFKIHSGSGKIKFAPKAATGYNYALGNWAVEEQDGKATALAAAGFSGTWAILDVCRGYAWIVMSREPLKEEKLGIYRELMTTINEQFTAGCK